MQRIWILAALTAATLPALAVHACDKFPSYGYGYARSYGSPYHPGYAPSYGYAYGNRYVPQRAGYAWPRPSAEPVFVDEPPVLVRRNPVPAGVRTVVRKPAPVKTLALPPNESDIPVKTRIAARPNDLTKPLDAPVPPADEATVPPLVLPPAEETAKPPVVANPETEQVEPRDLPPELPADQEPVIVGADE